MTLSALPFVLEAVLGGTHDICALHIRLKAFDAVVLYTSRLLRKYAHVLDDIWMLDDCLSLCPHRLIAEGDPSAWPRAEQWEGKKPQLWYPSGYGLNFAMFQA